MCGIYASVSRETTRTPSDALKHLLHNRGPDHIGDVQSGIKGDNLFTRHVYLHSTVLALRGGHVTAQPFGDLPNGPALCWNGEAWKLGSQSVLGNDGNAVFNHLVNASSKASTISASKAAILSVLQGISGPFAFVYLDTYHKQLYFGRDRLGRRSLLLETSEHSTIQLSSVADPVSGTWSEVEAEAVYSISLEEEETLQNVGHDGQHIQVSFAAVHKHMWYKHDTQPSDVSTGTFNKAVPSKHDILGEQTSSVQSLRHHLSDSLKLRVLNIPTPPEPDCEHPVRVAVLFSGGLDCTVLARLAHDILPLDQKIDLINVAFENPRVVKAAMSAKAHELSKKKDCWLVNTGQSQQIEPMPNVEQPSPYESCPDRETGRKSLEELQRVCPGRMWQFVAVDVPYKKTLEHRVDVVHLICPHNTEMDLSIAYALYFASRGVGTVTSHAEPTPRHYRTPSRVLLSGLGADELFGGYTRHATAFNRMGFPGLVDELKLDVDRLGKRNLGRDDRVISHWAREARFPYLDEALVKWAVECPVWQKCGFQRALESAPQIPDLEPGKQILRFLAYELGMTSVAMEKKRAIQFGARTAKMEVGKTKGTTLIS